MRRAELAPPAAIEKIDTQANAQPDKETQPRHNRQSGHQQDAEEDAEHREEWSTGTAETAVPVRIFVTQHQDTDRNQHKGE
jgi:hypothetical protein